MYIYIYICGWQRSLELRRSTSNLNYLASYLSTCLPVSLPACLPTYLLVILPKYLTNYLAIYGWTGRVGWQRS